MRSRASEIIRRLWAGELGAAGSVFSIITAPLSGLFSLVVWARNAAYDMGWIAGKGVSVPVISVGNLSVGGTGKTPVSAWFLDRVAELGRVPGLVLRGYGDDEVQLHRRWHPDLPVEANSERLAAALEAVKAGATCLVLDDGFQHRRLSRDFDVVLLSAEQGVPGPLLPRGPFRESLVALARADAVVVTQRTAPEDQVERVRSLVRKRFGGPLGTVRLVPVGWSDLGGANAGAPDGSILCVTSIASPEAFVEMVERVTGGAVRQMTFADHHSYEDADIERILIARGDGTVVTTEKDAVKLVQWGHRLEGSRVLRLGVEPDRDMDDVLDALQATLAEHDEHHATDAHDEDDEFENHINADGEYE